ncbi:DUF262 domain-containing protein [Mucilaginibacter sp. X5P1]|uniref:DUF262 domain-containing protein n=1 Tax=Mucilaginibacter sp. X5P1 TaxID=2723088 RepID=UPI001609B80A|nr:DUF262 domain-containing protein [Mucilaginibacter sp. X5P1]MBB6139879.1 hypothetical protein [Mucilaginibacter sp. X5P1]
MNPGRYTLKSFFTYQNLDQVLIPEIQRDYVWTTENVGKLIKSLLEDFHEDDRYAVEVTSEKLNIFPPQVKDLFVRALEQQKPFSNIGFLYAYSDSDDPNKYMLIDGQQRLTTLFLILMFLYIREGNQEKFRRGYFANKLPKVDYKVRENAHVFLIDYIGFLLGGGDISQVKNQFWFYKSYETDQTITAFVSNYQHIIMLLNKQDLTTEYIENQVEFWYFDTNKSEQGEDLYLYMNSRGETVETNENIKAELLQRRSDADKQQYGLKWEEWQHLFWENRDKSPTADRGFNEFLRWIKMIEVVRDGKKDNNLTETLRQLRENDKFSSDGLTMEKVESCYLALKRLLAVDLGVMFDIAFLRKQPDIKDYISLFPLLMFAERYTDASPSELKRYVRFFYNVTRFENVSKSPYQYMAQTVQMTAQFIAGRNRDVARLATSLLRLDYDNLLTKEEIWKLKMYAQATGQEYYRTELEDLFWEAEDFVLCNGRIRFLWEIMNFDPDNPKKALFKKATFISFYQTFKQLFNNPNDILRRAFLAKGDYSIADGNSSILGGSRWSFGQSLDSWRTILHDEDKVRYLRALLADVIRRKRENKTLTNPQVLKDIADAYISNGSEDEWIYHFIANPGVLAYCQDKYIVLTDENVDGIYLLSGKLAVVNGYEPLKKFAVKTAKQLAKAG